MRYSLFDMNSHPPIRLRPWWQLALRVAGGVAVCGLGGIAALAIGATATFSHFCGDGEVDCTPGPTTSSFVASLLFACVVYLFAITMAAWLISPHTVSAGAMRFVIAVLLLAPLFPAATLVTLWVNEHQHGHATAVAVFALCGGAYLAGWLAFVSRMVPAAAREYPHA
jgi:hypothetical protein